MINRNEAEYTNFDGKTNKKIIQSPGGSSSISLGWDNNPTDYSRGANQHHEFQKHNPYSNNNYEINSVNNKKYQKQQQRQEVVMPQTNSYRQVYEDNYNNFNNNNNMSRNQAKESAQSLIGGEYGYNNYNQNGNKNNKNTSYSQADSRYQQPIPIYKPQSYDSALQEQKYKVQSSRNQRSNIQGQGTKINQPQQSNDQRSCVKLKAHQQNNLFGNQYDYWKQDGHNEDKNNFQGNTKNKDNPYQYEKNNQYSSPTLKHNQYPPSNNNNEKTSVRVHNPPGGRTNFTLG